MYTGPLPTVSAASLPGSCKRSGAVAKPGDLVIRSWVTYPHESYRICTVSGGVNVDNPDGEQVWRVAD